MKLSNSKLQGENIVITTCVHHFKKHRSSDGHPVQFDLEGGVQGEVAVVITTAPLGPVAAVVHVHVQGDRLLLGDCSSWRTDGGREVERQTDEEAEEAEGEMDGMMGGVDGG